MAADPANSRATMYDVTWNALALGGLDDVTPNFAMMLRAIKLGSYGPVKLGDRFLGLDDGAKVDLILRETVRTTLQKFMPWATQTANAELAMTPTMNVDLYTFAQSLILHPRDHAGGVATGEDIELYKTVPVNALELPRTGNDEDKWKVTFLIYPNRTTLTTTGVLEYGRMKQNT